MQNKLKKLLITCQLDEDLIQKLNMIQADKIFNFLAPNNFIARIAKGSINDPILKQILPEGLELEKNSEFISDPLQEKNYSPVPGLLHKYFGRALILVTNSCPINCRFCFRRHIRNAIKPEIPAILNYLQNDKTITEIILSGGDPLILDDTKLAELIANLAAISHIKRLRIHSRIPIVMPKRITKKLAKILTNSRLQTVLVIHCNHANEIDKSVSAGLQKLDNANIMLLNQSVLLKGVNDSEDALINLSEKLFANHVQPYYLHMLDKVAGSAHFAVSEIEALNLLQSIAKRLPGYLVPKLVKDDNSKNAKTIIAHL